ncbi:hypothetical protein F0U61_41335 [Archangium violaceum]|uniref:hypothetical protein n=1 Tax=Archangium violaceum TaxID=83451 RepID=UPI002B31CDF6|nr:hypothetical protein F0U61_41335 [Archangium violaceum]
MKDMELKMGLSGPDLPALVRAVAGRLFPKTTPNRVYADFKAQTPGPGWLEAHLVNSKRRAYAEWQDSAWKLLVVHAPVVMAEGHFPKDPHRVVSELAPLPFALGSFGSLFLSWKAGTPSYSGPILDALHYPHGWACAFRGAGHSRLVSRRWLEFGPWRLLRGADDLSLVQFHDLEVDAATAQAQAAPGHARLGPSAEGGFIRVGHRRTHELNGLYDPKDKILRIIVHGRDVSQEEMLDACALRLEGMVEKGQPLARVAYIFMEPQKAREHLHELWLRELECWTIELGKEVRLDTDYRPKPSPPDWVKALEAREAAASKR